MGRNRNVELKSVNDKKLEVLDIIGKINALGLSTEIEGVKLFYQKCNQFINDSFGQSGKIKLTGYKREIVFNLPQRKDTPINVNLRYDETI